MKYKRVLNSLFMKIGTGSLEKYNYFHGLKL